MWHGKEVLSAPLERGFDKWKKNNNKLISPSQRQQF